MDYYLYTHSNADGIFYIGKGCKYRDRAIHMTTRSKEWYKASKGGYTYKLEANGTEADILALEKAVIKSLVAQGVGLVNKIHNPTWKGASFGLIRSKKTRKRMSNRMKGNTQRLGKKHSLASKYKMAKHWQHRRLVKANEYGG